MGGEVINEKYLLKIKILKLNIVLDMHVNEDQIEIQQTDEFKSLLVWNRIKSIEIRLAHNWLNAAWEYYLKLIFCFILKVQDSFDKYI